MLDNTGGNTIGGTSSGAANLFGFNSAAGLQIAGTNELVIGNLFDNEGNGTVGVLDNAGGNTIGGTSAGAANDFG